MKIELVLSQDHVVELLVAKFFHDGFNLATVQIELRSSGAGSHELFAEVALGLPLGLTAQTKLLTRDIAGALASHLAAAGIFIDCEQEPVVKPVSKAAMIAAGRDGQSEDSQNFEIRFCLRGNQAALKLI